MSVDYGPYFTAKGRLSMMVTASPIASETTMQD